LVWTRGSCPPASSRRTAAISQALLRAHILVLDLLSKVGIYRFRAAQHRFHRDVIEVRNLVDERIFSWKIVWNGTLLQPLITLNARRTHGSYGRGIQLKCPGPVNRLGQVDRVLHQGSDGQQVTMPDKVRRHGSLIAA